MKKINKYHLNLFPILLIVITVIIAIRNYTPGTWLTGWDTLHPEFNFGIQLRNVIFGAWRSDQGLGAVAAHSHMSELPRILLLWLFSLVLPVSFLRYFYVFLCFILGPLGIYVFLHKAVLRKNNLISSVAAFLGGLFYIFNLGTVQHFYVPFEMFTTQYAALGWLFYFATKYFYHRHKKDLALFAVISFISAPMAYSALLWYAYTAGLAMYLLTLVIFEKRKIFLKTGIIILFITFLTNAFWILPNWYFYATHAKDVPLSQINRLFSEEAFLHNKQYGNLKDAVIFKNFLFNWTHWMGTFKSEEILLPWKAHLSNQFIAGLGYVFTLMVGIGIILTLVKRNRIAIALLPVALVSLLMIINMNPPFEIFSSSLREHFSIIKEGLRFPWTKFSLLLMFSFSVFFGQFWNSVLSRVKNNFLIILISLIPVVMLFIYGWQMFNGNLIDRQMRIKIPDEYFELFTWMNKQPEIGRVAPLPMHSIWGWEYYDWGYQGAGFLWFGLKQPVLARDFDRWNPTNEQYYREMSEAIYTRDAKQLESLAEKYQIRYFILDKSVIFPANKPNALWFYETESVLNESQRIHLVKNFGDKLSVYTFDFSNSTTSFIQAPQNYITVGPNLTGGYHDQAITDFSTYVSDENPDVIYPARSLLNQFGRVDPKNVVITDNQVVFRFDNTQIPDNYIPEKISNSNSIYPEITSEFYPEKLAVETNSFLYDGNEQLLLAFPIESKPIYIKDQPQQTKECGIKTNKNSVSKRTVIDDYVSFIALSGDSCDYVNFGNLLNNLGQLLVIEARNISGLPLRVCVTNSITRRCDINTELDQNPNWQKYYFIVPPIASGTTGYDVHLNTVSIGNIRSENQVRLIQMFTIPYYQIQSLSYINKEKDNIVRNNGLSLIKEQDLSPLFYKIKLQTQDKADNLLVLKQSFDSGWQAFVKTDKFPYFTRLDNHILVNNWANGWTLGEQLIINNQQQTIYLFFWPQALEWVGFLLIFVSLLYLIRY